MKVDKGEASFSEELAGLVIFKPLGKSVQTTITVKIKFQTSRLDVMQNRIRFVTFILIFI